MTALPARLRSRFTGVLVGAAVADAFAVRSRRSLPTTATPEPDLASRGSDVTLGLYAIADCLARVGSFDHDRMATALRASRASVSDASAAARVAPVVLFAFPSLEQTLILARASAGVTHATETALQATSVMACALRLVMGHTSNSALDVVRFVSSVRTQSAAPQLAEALCQIETLRPAPVPTASSVWTTDNSAAAAVAAALLAFVQHHQSFEEVVLHSLGVGGDRPAVSAMAGALAGGYLGLDAIPPAWCEATATAPLFERLGRRLFALSQLETAPSP